MEVVADGIFVDDVGELLEADCSTSWGMWSGGGGGHDLASWKFRPYGNYIGRDFSPHANVRFAYSGATVFEGEFTGAYPSGDGTVTMLARGWGHRLFDYPAIYMKSIPLEPDHYAPTNQLTDIDTANSPFYAWEYAKNNFGLNLTVKAGTTLPGTQYKLGSSGHISEKPLTVGDALTGRYQEDGKRWAVWRKELLAAADDFSNPIVWDAPEEFVAVNAEDYRTHIGVWYKVPVTGSNPRGESAEWATDTEMLNYFDPKAEFVDMRGLGEIGQPRALQLANQILALVRGRFIYDSNKLVITQGMNFPVFGPTLRAGTAMRLNHLRTSVGSLIPEGENVFIVGRTELQWRADTDHWELSITPMGAAPRDLASILRGVPADSTPAVAA